MYLVSSELVNVSRDRDAVLIQKPALTWLTTVGQDGVFIVFLRRRFPLCSDSRCGEVMGVTMCWQTSPALPFLVEAPFHSESWLAPSAAGRMGGQEDSCCSLSAAPSPVLALCLSPRDNRRLWVWIYSSTSLPFTSGPMQCTKVRFNSCFYSKGEPAP